MIIDGVQAQASIYASHPQFETIMAIEKHLQEILKEILRIG